MGEPPSPAGLRVLVVDDNRDVADSTASVMRMNGCDVHVAYDGKAAIESVQRLRPDAVLLDIGLPTIDGYLVAEHIRAQPENGRTMIVAVSGYGQEQDRARSKSVGLRLSRGKAHRSDGARRASIGSLRLSRDGARGETPRCRCRTRAPDGVTSGVCALPPRTVRYSAFAPATLAELAERAFARAAGAPAIEGNAVRLLCDARENFPGVARSACARRSGTSCSSRTSSRTTASAASSRRCWPSARGQASSVHVIVDWLGAGARCRCGGTCARPAPTCASSIRRGCRVRSAGCRATIARRSSSTARSATSAGFASASAGSAIRGGASSHGATPASRSAGLPSRRSSRRSSPCYAACGDPLDATILTAAGQRSRRRARCGCT